MIKKWTKNLKSGFVEGRMFCAALEICYANPSDKRLKEIEKYAEDVLTNSKLTLSARKKANILSGECRDRMILKDMLQRYSRLVREGVL